MSPGEGGDHAAQRTHFLSAGIVVFRQDFGNTGSYGAGNALTMFEAFKIYGGQIHAVEAFMVVMPENTPSGWPAYEVKKPK